MMTSGFDNRGMAILKRFPLNPPHPERNCWGCDKYCPAGSLACGNGSERSQHPAELFGEDWAQQGLDPYLGTDAKLSPV
jgi:hypothetical protein